MKDQDSLDLRTRLSRRKLLAGMSGLTVALTSPIWRSSTVFGQDQNVPGKKRFLAFFSSNGTVPARFWPQGTGFDSPLVLSECLEPLERHKQNMLVLKGLHMNSTIENNLGMGDGAKPGGPHMKGPGAMLTGGSLTEGEFTGSGGPAGYADRVSVDQFLAQNIGQTTRFPSIEFGVRMNGQEPLRYISYGGPSMPNTPVDDPWKIYERVFADISAGTDDGKVAQALLEKKSVLDFLSRDLQRLGKRVNSEDKARLDAHLEQIRELERRLEGGPVSCEPFAMPAPLDLGLHENFPELSRLQIDLMLLAHSCDLTRVSSFMFANANSWQMYPWLDINEEHHEISHAGDEDVVQNDKLVKIHRWHSEQFGYILDQLALQTEQDGSSMLDSSLLLWGNELGAGNTHTYKDIPWVLAGGASGALKPGRYLQYGDMPHNNLLVSVCQAMGMPDVNTFGIPGVCTGPAPGLAG